VPGAGRDYWANWIKVYQRIQSAKKAFCLNVPLKDLDLLFDVLQPEGAWVTVDGIQNNEIADKVLSRFRRWE
jgi:hypothetical protein